jgi:hypothetical protein
MTYKTFTTTQEVTAVHIQTMEDMSLEEYKKYLDGGLFFVDHHGILRSGPAEYPLAVTKVQFETMLSFLKMLDSKVGVD